MPWIRVCWIPLLCLLITTFDQNRHGRESITGLLSMCHCRNPDEIMLSPLRAAKCSRNQVVASDSISHSLLPTETVFLNLTNIMLPKSPIKMCLFTFFIILYQIQIVGRKWIPQAYILERMDVPWWSYQPRSVFLCIQWMLIDWSYRGCIVYECW
jgi:hypothetical protein